MVSGVLYFHNKVIDVYVTGIGYVLILSYLSVYNTMTDESLQEKGVEEWVC